jgi:hypothetical protein
MQGSVTRGVLSARRIRCLPFYQADFGNWTDKDKVFHVQAMKACCGRRGVAPLILNLDTKWRGKFDNEDGGGIGVTTGPDVLPFHSIRVLNF